MDREIFAAGVVPGGPATKNEVKTLLCWLLAELRDIISFELLHEALREDGLVNYFELCDALSQLCETGHVSRAEENEIEFYGILPLGEQTAAELSPALPAAVREKARRSAHRLLARKERISQVRIGVREEKGGYLLTLALPDGEAELISMTVFAPTKPECDKLRRRFLNDPVFIYKSVMSLLSGRRDILGEVLPETEELF